MRSFICISRYFLSIVSPSVLARKFCLLTCLLLLVNLAHAQQAGGNDNTFNTADVGFGQGDGIDQSAFVVAVQPDGKLVVGGNFTFYNSNGANRLVRLNTDGSLDTGFSGNGANDIVTAIALQTDGKIIIGGNFTSSNNTNINRIARLNPNGTLDATFNSVIAGPDGLISTIAVQADGKILIGGSFNNYNNTPRSGIARLNADGSLDTSFNPAGSGLAPSTGSSLVVGKVVVQADGKIIIGGGFVSYNGTSVNYLVRVNTDGSLDTGFNSAGSGVDGPVYDLSIQSDGKIIIGGLFSSYNGTVRSRIARVNADGSLDTGFNPAANATVRAIELQPDGKILIGGDFTSFNGTTANHIARLNDDGSLDTSFNPAGSGADKSVYDIAVAGDDRIIMVGDFTTYNDKARYAIARLEAADGSEVQSPQFNPGSGVNIKGVLAVGVNVTVVQPDDKILIGGDFFGYNGGSRNNIARLNADGSLDAGFNPPLVFRTVNAIALQADGKVIIAASGGTLMRLNADGSLDNSFNSGTGAGGDIMAIALQADGKIIIGGHFTTYKGTVRSRIARVNADGSLDTGFNPGTGANSSVFAISLQADGKIIIGGVFNAYNGTTNINRIARLNADGSLDTSFNPGSGVSGSVRCTALQTDGKIIIGGLFSLYNGTGRKGIARLNADGSLDTTFDPGLGFSGGNAIPRSITMQANGKLIIGGDFTTFNNVARLYIARLNANGSLDTNFLKSPLAGASKQVNGTALQADGKLIIGGIFTSYNSNTIGRNRIARLYNTDIPDAPTGLIASAGDGSASVSFTAAASNGSAITNYEYSINGGTWTPLSPASTTSPLSITGLTNCTTYNIQIRAVNSVGSGAASGSVSVTPRPGNLVPDKPAITGITPSFETASVAFTAPADIGSSAITNYEYSTNNGATWTTRSPLSTTSPLTVTGLAGATSYQVQLRAVNTAGVGCASASVNTTTLTPAVPGAPTIISATATNGTAYVNFTPPADNGGAAITNYQYSIDGITWIPLSPSQTTSPLIITGLTNCTTYNGQIRAVNSAGPGAASGALSVTSRSGSPIGTTWTARTSASDNDWQSVTYGNGLFVAVAYTGTGNRVMTSTDGISWTARSTPDRNWASVTYGNGLFVAVGQSTTMVYTNNVMTSPDGINWTIQTHPSAAVVWGGVTYGNGLFVAVARSGIGNKVMTSPDGITWTTRTLPPDIYGNNWTSVTYGNGLFVAVASAVSNNSSSVMTSPDGITWTARTSAADNSWTSVTYGNGLFVAVAKTGTGNRVMTSPDGINWTSRTSVADNQWYSVTYGNGLFVAVASAVSNNSSRVMTSPDGITWTARTSAPNNQWTSVNYGNGLFVAVAQSGTGNRVMTSSELLVPDKPAITGITPSFETASVAFTAPTDIGSSAITNYEYSTNNGGSWTAISPASTTSPLTVTGLAGATSYQVQLRAVNTAGTGCASATENVTTLSLPGAPTITSVAAGDGSASVNFTPPADDGGAAITNYQYSIDGGTWTSLSPASTTSPLSITGLTNCTTYSIQIRAVTAGEGAASGSVSVTPRTGLAGITWTARTSAADISWKSVTYGNGLFVAVASTGTGNRVMTSPDGITWTARSSPNNNWYSVTYGDGKFVAVGGPTDFTNYNNAVMTSPDGITWTIRTHPTAIANFGSITYGNGLFVAVAFSGAGTRVMTSPDGITWTIRTAPNLQWISVTYGNGLFVAVANTGTGNRVMTSPDGITWTARTSAADDAWQSVTYGNGLFVAVAQFGTGTRVMTSPDGINWTARTPAAVRSWSSVTYGNGLFVAVATSGTGDRVMTSPDGITWTIRTSAPDNSWGSVTYGNNLFVAVAGGPGNQVMTSSELLVPDKPAITAITPLATNMDVVFTAPADDGGAAISNYEYSTNNGVTWTAISPASTTSPLTITGLTAETAYQVQLRAVNTAGAGCASASENVTTLAVPAAPTNISAAAGDGSASVNFTSPADDGGAAISNYEYTIDGGSTWITLSPAQNTSPLSISGLTNCTTYSIQIRAVTSSGSGAASGTVTVTPRAGSPIGTAWTSRPTTDNTAQWTGVTYGNGLYVAINQSGTNRVMTSPDGINWTAQAAVASLWKSVAYGNGLFVAVGFGPGDQVMTSPDGINWTARTPASVAPWFSVTYGNGLFVAVANTQASDQTVMTSPDGINWTIRTAAAVRGWFDITYGNGLFVAVATQGTGDRVMTSPDGINWTTRTTPVNYDLHGVTFGNGLFVAVAYDSKGLITSPDGVTWTARTVTNRRWTNVAYGNGLFVVVSNENQLGDGVPNLSITSPDGINWTPLSTGVERYWVAVTYGDGLFVSLAIGGPSGDRLMTLPQPLVPDKPAITVITPSATSADVAFTPPADNGGSVITNYEYSTDNGVTWTAISPVSTTSPLTITGLTAETNYQVQLRAVNIAGAGCASDAVNTKTLPAVAPGAPTNLSAAAGDGSGSVSFTPPANDGGAAISNYEYTIDGGSTWITLSPAQNTSPLSISGLTNCTTYSIQIRAVNSAGEGTASGSVSVTPLNGRLIWTSQTPAQLNIWNSVIYENGLFVAVSQNGDNRVMTSTDGISWTAQNATEDAFWRSVAYGNGVFVAVANYNGTSQNFIMTSGDGITWTTRPAPNFNWLSDVTFANGLFVATAVTGGTDRVITSPDGINWTTRTTTDVEWKSVTYGNGIFVAVSRGDGGYNTPISTNNLVMTSTDGITWTTRTSPVKNPWWSVAFGNGTFVAVSNRSFTSQPAEDSTCVMTSTDGITWTMRSTPGSVKDWNEVSFGNGLFIAVSSEGNYLMTSRDGITWTSSTGAITDATSVTYGNGKFVAVSSGGVMTSSDLLAPDKPAITGITPSFETASVAFTAPADIGSSAITNYEYSTNNGATWTTRSPESTTSPLTISGLTPTTNYQVQLRAVNIAGAGCASDMVPTTTLRIPPPAITAISPSVAVPGTSVTLTGTGFSTTAGNNIVYFGAVRAVVTAVTGTTVTVTVPEGATYGPVTVLNTDNGLSGASLVNFTPTFPEKPCLVFEDGVTFPGSAVRGLAISDFNGDGQADVAAAAYNDKLQVYRNVSTTGSISLSAPVELPAAEYGSQVIAVGDLNGDGKPDLATVGFMAGVSVFPNTSTTAGAISFGPKMDLALVQLSLGVAIGDLDGDGKPELVATSLLSDKVSVFFNTSSTGGAISFAGRVDYATGDNPNSVAIGDLDGDGKSEIVTSNVDGNNVSVFRNTSVIGVIDANSFANKVEYEVGTYPYTVVLGDLNGDGKMEIVTANESSHNVSVLRNTSSSGVIDGTSFATAVNAGTGEEPYTVAIGDVNGDGKPDLAAASGSSGVLSVLRNTSANSSISFAAAENFPAGSYPMAVAIGDLDGDGAPELVSGNDWEADGFWILRNSDPKEPISAGTIDGNQSGYSPFDPVAFTSTTAPSGQIGTLEYKWQSSTTSATTGFSDISGATGETYDAGSLTVKTWFRRLSRVTCQADPADWTNAAVSNAVAITIIIPPTITAISPSVAVPGTSVTLTGTGFSATAGNNIVYFGATRAVVTAVTGTTVTVTVPEGATYGPVTLLNTDNGLSGASLVNFTPTFPEKPCLVFEDGVTFPGSQVRAVAISDFDGDGKSDLAAVSYQGDKKVKVYRNISSVGVLGQSSFSSPVEKLAGDGAQSISVGDLDGDGKPDMAVANYGSYTISVYLNTSTGPGNISFADKLDLSTGFQSDPISVAIGDLDGDGKPELVSVNSRLDNASVFQNTSTGPGNLSFATKVDLVTGDAPYSVAIGDVDGDGKADLAVSNLRSASVSVLRNVSTVGGISVSSFSGKVDYATGSDPYTVRIGDLDGDGKPELVTADFTTNNFIAGVTVLRNTATAGVIDANSFAAKVSFLAGKESYAVTLGDVNGDGKPDLVKANGGSKDVSVFLNTSISGTIGFAAGENFPAGGYPMEVAVGDLDGDGAPELVSGNDVASNGFWILRNSDPKEPTSGGTIAGDQSGYSPFDPAAFTSTTAPGGQIGTLEYKWQSSTTSATTGFSDISGATGETYDAGALTVKTWFRRLSRVTCQADPADWSNAAVSNPVEVTPLPPTITGTLSVCTNGTSQLTGSSTPDATTPWSSSNTSVATIDNTGLVTGIVAGTATITYRNSGGITQTAVVTVQAPPAITGSLNAIVNGTTQLTGAGTPDATTPWKSSDLNVATISSTGLVSGVAAGTSTITYRNAAGCESTAQVTVILASVVAVDPNFTSTPVNGFAGGSAGNIYQNVLVNGQPLQPSQVITTLTGNGGITGLSIASNGSLNIPAGTPAGTYTVTYRICLVAYSTICDEVTATVKVDPPVLNAVDDDFSDEIISNELGGTVGSIFSNDQLSGQPLNGNLVTATLVNNGGLTGATLGEDGVITIPPDAEPGEYTLTIRICEDLNPTNCEESTVKITIEYTELNTAGAVTPNGDGKNDFFHIRGLSAFPKHSLVIVNRWGNAVYKAAPYNNDWDGKSQNSLTFGGSDKVPAGTYFFVLDKGDGTKVTGSFYLAY